MDGATVTKLPYVLGWGEKYDDVVKEASSMIADHWKEVGSFRHLFRLRPDHNRYRTAQEASVLHILTARRNGLLCGYLFMAVSKYPRNANLSYAVDDSFYVRPECRRDRLGVLMLEEAIRSCENAGVNILAFRHKAWRRGLHSYLERYGFEAQEVVFAKILSVPSEERPEEFAL